MTKNFRLGNKRENIRATREGDLNVVLFVSESTEVFDEEQAEHEALTLPQIVGLAVGETVHVGTLVSGYTLGQDGLADFVVDMEVLAPDGRAVVIEKEWSRYRDEAPRQPSFIMVRHRFDLETEPGDPPGEYRIIAEVRDLLSGKQKSCAYSLQLLDL